MLLLLLVMVGYSCGKSGNSGKSGDRGSVPARRGYNRGSGNLLRSIIGRAYRGRTANSDVSSLDDRSP